MPKPKSNNLKAALTNSLQAEDEAVRDRFERAESLLGQSAKKEVEKSADIIKEDLVYPVPEPKQKIIRDSFTMPEEDAQLIGILQQRCLVSLNIATNKSELIRAGLHALRDMSNEELQQVIESLEKIKTGRPAQKK